MIQEGSCTAWSRRGYVTHHVGYAPRGPGGGVHHVVQEGVCTMWFRRGYEHRGPGRGVHRVVQERA